VGRFKGAEIRIVFLADSLCATANPELGLGHIAENAISL